MLVITLRDHGTDKNLAEWSHQILLKLYWSRPGLGCWNEDRNREIPTRLKKNCEQLDSGKSGLTKMWGYEEILCRKAENISRPLYQSLRDSNWWPLKKSFGTIIRAKSFLRQGPLLSCYALQDGAIMEKLERSLNLGVLKETRRSGALSWGSVSERRWIPTAESEYSSFYIRKARWWINITRNKEHVSFVWSFLVHTFGQQYYKSTYKTWISMLHWPIFILPEIQHI